MSSLTYLLSCIEHIQSTALGLFNTSEIAFGISALSLVTSATIMLLSENKREKKRDQESLLTEMTTANSYIQKNIDKYYGDKSTTEQQQVDLSDEDKENTHLRSARERRRIDLLRSFKEAGVERLPTSEDHNHTLLEASLATYPWGETREEEPNNFIHWYTIRDNPTNPTHVIHYVLLNYLDSEGKQKTRIAIIQEKTAP